MIRRIAILLFVAAGIGLATVAFPSAHAANRVWVGGGVGLGFGDVDYVSIEPVVGVRILPKFSAGVRLMYRYRNDSRFEDDFSTTDYGASLFGRYRVVGPAFVQAEYERLSYEYRVDGSNQRDKFDSVLAGAGVSQPLGGRASFFALALYNFSYDSGDPFSPYSDPWIFRVGVGFAF
jgi:hypothetical protein